MSNPAMSTAPSMTALAVRSGLIVLVVSAMIFLLLGPRTLSYIGQAAAGANLHAPRLELLAQASLAMKIHLGTVSAALVLATVQMVGPKGRTSHRMLGWMLVILLLTTAVASLFIRNPQGGLFNPFQLFSVWTLIGIPLAVVAAHRHNVAFHARMMSGFYFGSLIFAGALTFLPGRLMWRVFFG